MSLPHRYDPVPVIRVDDLLPCIESAGKFTRGIAQYLIDPAIPVQCTLSDVPVPDHITDTLGTDAEPLLTLDQLSVPLCTSIDLFAQFALIIFEFLMYLQEFVCPFLHAFLKIPVECTDRFIRFSERRGLLPDFFLQCSGLLAGGLNLSIRSPSIFRDAFTLFHISPAKGSTTSAPGVVIRFSGIFTSLMRTLRKPVLNIPAMLMKLKNSNCIYQIRIWKGVLAVQPP